MIESRFDKKYFEPVLKKCKKHGDLYLKDLIKSGKLKSGNQYYKCRLCNKELHAANYLRNHETIRQHQQKFRTENKEKWLKQKSDSYHRHKDTPENRIKYKLRNWKYRADNHAEVRRRERIKKGNTIKELRDTYIKNLIQGRDGNFPRKDITEELIVLKRFQVQIKRFLKTKGAKIK